ncbi:small ribosomal subunit protein mS37 [Ambystoma mexicanum]|uniref:small ribosomal subunit protein mS37 n=1 Tax=Ambystoma mexicanum TaxID=8296 RepID=UPI0037E8AF65
MASSGSTLQARVIYLMSGRRGKPALTSKRELALADRVANRKGRLGEATCLTEMSMMMACWKQNAFSDSVCGKEIQAFFTCSAEAEAQRRAGKNSESETGRLPPNQVNQLLRRFPNIKHEI